MKKNNSWKGYDMEELRILRATTALRIDTTDIVEAAEYGLKTYRIVKKVTNLFRKKKK